MTKSRHVAPPRRRWTEAELGILRRNYPHFPTEKVAQQLGRTARQLYSKAKNLGLKKTPAYLASAEACRLRRGDQTGAPWRFKPGQVPWNAGKKGVSGLHPNTVANHFGPGHRPHTWLPVGSTRISRDGYLQRKLTDTGYAPRDWVAVHRTVWEAVHGPIPPGHHVCFKGGKATVDEALIVPEILECVSQAEMMRRNSLHNLPKPVAELIQLRGALNRKINQMARRDQQREEEAS